MGYISIHQRGCCNLLFSPFDNSNMNYYHDVIMNIDKIIVRHSALTNGTAGLLISLITYLETPVPIRIESISLYFPDCMFGGDRSRLTVWCETTYVSVCVYFVSCLTHLRGICTPNQNLACFVFYLIINNFFLLK